jgi:hypothetical protein
MLMRGERCRTLSLRPCLLPPEPGQGERLHQPKEFRSMKKVNFQSKNGQNITIAALINFPQGFEESKQYPAMS